MREWPEDDGYLRMMRFMLIVAFRALEGDTHLSPAEQYKQASQARYWIERGEVGGVSYAEACHWCQVDPERGRRAARKLWAEHWDEIGPGPAREAPSLALESHSMISEMT